MIDLGGRGDVLIDVPRLVAQVEHDPVADRLVELVGVDVGAEDLDAGLPVGFQQRGSGEANEQGIGQQSLHRLVQLPGLGPVTLVDKHIDVALGREPDRQRLFHRLDIAGDIATLIVVLAGELVDQRAEQPRVGLVESGDQIGAALGPHDLFVHALEHLLDLLIEFGTVGDDQDPGVADMLPNPFGQPHHGQALSRPLGVPDDPARTPSDMILRGPHAEILVVAA